MLHFLHFRNHHYAFRNFDDAINFQLFIGCEKETKSRKETGRISKEKRNPETLVPTPEQKSNASFP